MGDRANAVVLDGPDDAVFLYSHWGGYELPETVRIALTPEARWDDPPYLARIVFDAMVGGDQGGETGFGISARICDNEYDLIVLHGQRLYRVPESAYREDRFARLDQFPSISFMDYVAAEARTWDNLTDPA